MTSRTIELSDQLQALKLFVQVARTGSISKGARAMKLSQPTASRIIALLEEQLGATLFSRSTRALVLTDSGSSYLARVQPILNPWRRRTIRSAAATICVERSGLPSRLSSLPEPSCPGWARSLPVIQIFRSN